MICYVDELLVHTYQNVLICNLTINEVKTT